MLSLEENNLVLSEILLYKELCLVKENIILGEIPDKDMFNELVTKFEKSDDKRVMYLKEHSEQNTSSSFLDDIVFRDNGYVTDGRLMGPIDGALDFIGEQSKSPSKFMQQVATYVATCL